MSLTDRREALKKKIDTLSEALLTETERFVEEQQQKKHAEQQKEQADRQRIELIRALPRIITDYPVLVWGWDPCDSNDIGEVWFGPLTTPVVRVWKAKYPNHQDLDRYRTLAMLVATSEGGEYSFADAKPGAWIDGVQISEEELSEFVIWVLGEGNWPCVYDPVAQRIQLADLKQVYTKAEYVIEELGEALCHRAQQKFQWIVEHIQSELRRRGTTLAADDAEVGFSINRENGTIDYLDARKFLPLIERTSAPAPTGILIAGDMTGKDLSGAQLEGSVLRTLSGANLSAANLRGADLSDADLSNADLSSADLTGANLQDAFLVGVIYDDKTRWPDEFTPPPSQ
jgi:hypothetical protein